MKWLVIALVCAVGIIGVETYLLMEPLPPPPMLRVIAIPPPAPPPPQPPPKPIAKRKVVRRPQSAHATTGNQHPFVMPTGGIFSGADPQDPRIYHFNAE
jgi:hypothetical protein